MALLRVQEPTGGAREVVIERARFYVGRLPDSDLHLTDQSVSRKHAKITRTDRGGFLLEDLDSTNGVLVNGTPTLRSALADGDQITVGDYRLTFVSGPDDGAAVVDSSVVQLEGVWKEYVLGSQTVTALKDIDLEIQAGEFLALAGPSGSGKSTLLNLIGCIDTPSRGEVYVDGRRVSEKTADQLADLRAETVGFIFQTFNLLPVLTAWENVEYPLLQNRDLIKSKRRQRVEHYLGVVGLSKFMHHRPNELSGGQRQRVAIARALAARPTIVLADEPTANLDHETGESILALMREINQAEGTTFIFSTHDARVMQMAGRVVGLADGELTQQEAI